MGMFDTVLVPCPRCGLEAEFQSKSGPCELMCTKLAETTLEILIDVNRHAPVRCKSCGVRFEVRRTKATSFADRIGAVIARTALVANSRLLNLHAVAQAVADEIMDSRGYHPVDVDRSPAPGEDE